MTLAQLDVPYVLLVAQPGERPSGSPVKLLQLSAAAVPCEQPHLSEQLSWFAFTSALER